MTAPVFGLAGRRIDAEAADPPRFPLSAAPEVRRRLAALFADRRPAALVCSAACGADLIALDEAGRRGIRRRIVLPFDRVRFRNTSVTDRPGDWGPLFDRVVDEVTAAGDLVTLDEGSGEQAYAAANQAIVLEARRLAATDGAALAAVMVWDGASRGSGDGTDGFRQLAVAAGFEEISIGTRG